MKDFYDIEQDIESELGMEHEKKSYYFISFFICMLILTFFFKFIVFDFFLKDRNLVKLNDSKKIKMFISDENYLLSNNKKKFKIYGSGKNVVQLEKNDNLFFALKRAGFSRENINDILYLLSTKINLRSLKQGQIFNVMYNSEIVLDNNKDDKKKYKVFPVLKNKIENKVITKLSFKMPKGIRYIVEKNNSGYVLQVEKPRLIVKTNVINGTIKNNLFADAIVGGIKISTLYNILNEYAFLIDFQRDLRYNDKFVFVVKTTKDVDGDVVDENVLYTNLILRNHDYEIFNFNGSFYDRKGKSIQKKLLKTPVDGARITSGFTTRRKHPVLGYTRAHKGVDMAVPTGTPIYAAGDGVVAEIKLNDRSYGKYVLIRHNSEYSTKYAHMSRVANIKKGQRVKQRQVIGYVGMTGLATGPHLHYEVIRYGKHVNPSKINAVEIKKLDHSKIPEFKKFVDYIDNTLKNLT